MTNIDTMKPIIAGAISNPAGTCGHGCEGNAYQIEIRRLNSYIQELKTALMTKSAQVETLHLTIQAASAAMAAAPIVSRFHREAIDALRIVQSTEAGGLE